jgi:heavy metal efflux system protein
MKFKKITIFILSAMSMTSYAQQAMTMDESIQYALKNNLQVKAGEYEVEQYRQLEKTHTELGKTSVMWMHGNYNSVNTDNNITITQSIPFPTVLMQQVRLGEAQTEGAKLNLSVTRNELIYQIRSIYIHLSYLKSVKQLLLSQDSLYAGFARASQLRYQTGESNLLEKTTAETQRLEIGNQVRQNESDILIYRTQLKSLLQATDLPDASESLHKLSLSDSLSITQNPTVLLSQQQVVINQQQKRIERNHFLPDITVGYFTQTLIGFQRVGNDEMFFDKNKRFSGIQLGVAIPLWFVPQAGRAKAASLAQSAAQKRYESIQIATQSLQEQALQEFEKNNIALNYYEKDALKNAALILDQAQKSFRSGEIGYLEYLQALRNAQSIRGNYLMAINQYNQSIARLKFLSGEN